MCAPPRLSEVSPTLPLKRFKLGLKRIGSAAVRLRATHPVVRPSTVLILVIFENDPMLTEAVEATIRDNDITLDTFQRSNS